MVRAIAVIIAIVQSTNKWEQKAMPFIKGQGLVNIQNFKRISKLVGRNGLGLLGTNPTTGPWTTSAELLRYFKGSATRQSSQLPCAVRPVVHLPMGPEDCYLWHMRCIRKEHDSFEGRHIWKHRAERIPPLKASAQRWILSPGSQLSGTMHFLTLISNCRNVQNPGALGTVGIYIYILYVYYRIIWHHVYVYVTHRNTIKNLSGSGEWYWRTLVRKNPIISDSVAVILASLDYPGPRGSTTSTGEAKHQVAAVLLASRAIKRGTWMIPSPNMKHPHGMVPIVCKSPKQGFWFLAGVIQYCLILGGRD